jgi:hypothetical protein
MPGIELNDDLVASNLILLRKAVLDMSELIAASNKTLVVICNDIMAIQNDIVSIKMKLKELK